MPKVFDHQLFMPLRQAIKHQACGRLETIEEELPQLVDHPLYYKSPMGFFIKNAAQICRCVEDSEDKRFSIEHGANGPLDEKIVPILGSEGNMSSECGDKLVISGIFGFKARQAEVSRPPKLEVYLSDGNDCETYALLGWFDLGRPEKREYPYSNDSQVLGYNLSNTASCIAIRTLVHNATYNDYA